MIQRRQLNIETLPDVIDLYLTEDVYDRCGDYCHDGECAIATLLKEAGLPWFGATGWTRGFSVDPLDVFMNRTSGVEDRYSIYRVGEGFRFGADHFAARWTGIIRLTRIEERTK